jgi:hypothetical protein
MTNPRYIIMGRDECGDEFRTDTFSYISEQRAMADLAIARGRHPESQSLWVEMLKDKDYYIQRRLSCDDPHGYDDPHGDYD